MPQALPVRLVLPAAREVREAGYARHPEDGYPEIVAHLVEHGARCAERNVEPADDGERQPVVVLDVVLPAIRDQVGARVAFQIVRQGRIGAFAEEQHLGEVVRHDHAGLLQLGHGPAHRPEIGLIEAWLEVVVEDQVRENHRRGRQADMLEGDLAP